MSGSRGAGRRRAFFLIGVAALLLRPPGARAAEWQLFGLEGFSGYLGLKSDGYTEQRGEASFGAASLEERVWLKLDSYVFHPRFLALSADTLFGLGTSTTGTASLRSLDSGLAVDFLRGQVLTLGLSGRSREEEFEQSFVDYRRKSAGASAYVNLQGAPVGGSVKYEVSAAQARKLEGGAVGDLAEDKLNQYLSVESSARLASSDVALRYRTVQTDDALGSDSLYHATEVTSGHRLFGDRGRLNLGLTAWNGVIPEEQRLTLAESLVTDWSARLRTTQNLELSRRRVGGVESLTYQGGLGATRDLSAHWSILGNLGAVRNSSAESESWTYRMSGGASYRGEWRGYKVGVQDTLTLSQTYAGPRKEVAVYNEEHFLPKTGFWEPLAYSYADPASVKVKDKATGVDWTAWCQIEQRGLTTWIRWAPPEGQDPTPPADQLVPVLVDYRYVLPTSEYADLTHSLLLRLSRTSAPGEFVESTLTVRNAVSGTAGPGFSGLDYAAARHEVGLQGTLNRQAYEVAAGVTTSRERNTVAVRGSTVFRGWAFSQSYQAEFFPDFVGQHFETRAARLWGIGEKTFLNLELADQMFSAHGSPEKGVTSARVRTTLLVNPFMRFEVEGRGEVNRLVADDFRLILDAKYVWQQGQLDFLTGYQYRFLTPERLTRHRLYVTLIRRF
jgi:hypothetical protein